MLGSTNNRIRNLAFYNCTVYSRKHLRYNKNMKKHKYVIVIVATVVLVLVGAVTSYYIAKPDQPVVKSGPRTINDVDYSEPTAEEEQAGDAQKKTQEARDELNKLPPPTAASVSIVDSSQYGDMFEIRAYISNIFEDGGICTATFSKEGAATVTQSATAAASATTTHCQTIDVPVSTFSDKGAWQLVISYQSDTASGATNPKTVTIQ